jgi:hypothetical protein
VTFQKWQQKYEISCFSYNEGFIYQNNRIKPLVVDYQKIAHLDESMKMLCLLKVTNVEIVPKQNDNIWHFFPQNNDNIVVRKSFLKRKSLMANS